MFRQFKRICSLSRDLSYNRTVWSTCRRKQASLLGLAFVELWQPTVQTWSCISIKAFLYLLGSFLGCKQWVYCSPVGFGAMWMDWCTFSCLKIFCIHLSVCYFLGNGLFLDAYPTRYLLGGQISSWVARSLPGCGIFKGLLELHNFCSMLSTYCCIF